MSNLIEILKWILIVVLLGAVCFFGFKSCNSDKKNIQLSQELTLCKNTPAKSDTVIVHDTITSVEYVYLKPKPKPNDNSGVQGTPNTPKHSTYYSENFKSKGVTIHWEAETEFKNDSAKIKYIRFPKIIVPREVITNTKTVHDTIPVEVPADIRSKFGFYGGLGAKDFKNFPMVEAGAMYLHKQSWGLQGGALYLDKSLYGTVKIFVTL